jgi:glucose-1-phosphate cytidylyltransferase
MQTYSHYGFSDFNIKPGYKGYIIKEYLANYFLHKSGVTSNRKDDSIKVYDCRAEP